MKQLPASLLGVAFLLCLSVVPVLGQSSWSKVTLTVRNPPELSVSIQLASPTNSWSFRNSFAGALGLADRVEQFRATGSAGVSVRTVATGEFRSVVSVDRVSYEVNVNPGSTADLPHISWLANDGGMLMLADLLPDIPEINRGVNVEFDLPAAWQVYSSIPRSAANFVVDEPEKSVFMIGRQLHLTSKRDGETELSLVTQGNWRFSDKEVLDAGLKILQQYQGLTGFKLKFTPTILIAPFPISGAISSWKAETRGPTSTLLLDSQASWKNWRAQLAIILTHELFHLWVPNSLQLKGDYDWFFEGFTSYIALQEALKLKLIPFEEYLNTLGRVYDSYLSVPDERSLLEASERRWTNSSPTVYDKGMLVAFLYDLLLRREASGRSSLADRYRTLFERFVDEPADANEVIIQTLASSPATSDFAKSYIESRNQIELQKTLPAFGIDVKETAAHTELRVSKELTDDQKKLLRTLGYRK